jgi:hypothetical protein
VADAGRLRGAELHARDPEKARQVLGELDQILLTPPRRGGDAPVIGEAEQRLLDQNPLLQEAFRVDPYAALQQLREIASLGSSLDREAHVDEHRRSTALNDRLDHPSMLRIRKRPCMIEAL